MSFYTSNEILKLQLDFERVRKRENFNVFKTGIYEVGCIYMFSNFNVCSLTDIYISKLTEN